MSCSPCASRALCAGALAAYAFAANALAGCVAPRRTRAAAPQAAGGAVDATAIDAYVRPYADSHNFAGTVLVMRGGRVVYERSSGDADRDTHRPDDAATRFHVASVSMQLTAAAVMRLVDRGTLALDARVVDLAPDALPGVAGAEAITVRHLLEQRSGLPDINERPDYDSILARHQTPASLVATVRGQPLLFAPGAEYRHEEHSAYNLLALIVERRTGRPFADAVRALVFEPAGMTTAAIDDDAPLGAPMVASGYQPRGAAGLEPAPPIHWSAKTGNGSAVLSARDYARFVDALVHGHLLSDASRALVLDSAGPRVGYGWFRGPRPRFGQAAFAMNGRAPGFASFVLYLPHEDLTVVAFSNVYSSATTELGYDVAAIATGRPYEPLVLPAHAPVADSLAITGARFAFGSDFYQPGATLAVEAAGGELFLRWPTGDRSPLIALDRDHLIDRAYWQRITVTRDSGGRAVALSYDRFRGTAVSGGGGR